MVAFELKTKQDIQDFATGCCFFGCGGGGDPEAGIVALTEVLEKGKPLQVTSFDDLKDDDTYASVFLMGSIAPKTDEIIAKQKRNGVPVDPPYSPQEMLSKSLDVLEEYTGKKISALFAIELGRRKQLHAHVRWIRQGPDVYRRGRRGACLSADDPGRCRLLWISPVCRWPSSTAMATPIS